MYGVYSLGGFALLSIMACVFVVGAFTLAAAASRSLGAGPRAFWLLFLPVLISAALGVVDPRTDAHAPALHGTPLAARQRRRERRRTSSGSRFRSLVVWGNLHGSAALGAMLVVLLGAYELIRTRGPSLAARRRPCSFSHRSQSSPPRTDRSTTARYYHLLLVDPPFAGQVTEWRWPAPASNTYAFYVCSRLRSRSSSGAGRRLTVFDMAVLAMTLAGALTAIRGIPWFAFACMIFVPVAIGRKPREHASPESRGAASTSGSPSASPSRMSLAAGVAVPQERAFFEDYWPT